jgi:hypothetical protein
MSQIFSRVQLAYLALFLCASAMLFGYAAVEVWPAEQCGSQGGWWDAQDRVCATPIPIERLTGHKAHAPAAEIPAKAKAPIPLGG